MNPPKFWGMSLDGWIAVAIGANVVSGGIALAMYMALGKGYSLALLAIHSVVIIGLIIFAALKTV